MSLHARSYRHITFMVTFLAIPGSRLHAQREPLPRWTISSGFAAIRVGKHEGWGVGPELSFGPRLGEHAGVRLRLSLPAFGTNAGGGAVDLGLTLTRASRHAEVGVAAGATAFLVGDNSELTGGGLGLFVGGHATAWVHRRFGLTTGLDLRLGQEGGLYPSLSAGIAVRL